MKRTQIYLDETTFEFLKKESQVENKSISEIIRESVRERMKHSKSGIKRGINSAFGIWKNRKFDTDEYIRNLRRDREI